MTIRAFGIAEYIQIPLDEDEPCVTVVLYKEGLSGATIDVYSGVNGSKLECLASETFVADLAKNIFKDMKENRVEVPKDIDTCSGAKKYLRRALMAYVPY